MGRQHVHREVRYVVPARTDLASVLLKLGISEGALQEGRVFVNAARAHDGARVVCAGDSVRVGAEGGTPAPFQILLDESGLVAVDKPFALPTVPDNQQGANSLLSMLQDSLRLPRLHATSRLDVGVSGVVVFATNDEARTRLAEARTRGAYVRQYVAICRGVTEAPRGTWDAPIGRAPDPRRRAPFGPDARAARSHFQVAAVLESSLAVWLAPETGRTHQLRVHTAHAGIPIYGDAAYGGPRRAVDSAGRVLACDRIYLHCFEVSVPLKDARPCRVRAPIPPSFSQLWHHLGGQGNPFDGADSDRIETPL